MVKNTSSHIMSMFRVISICVALVVCCCTGSTQQTDAKVGLYDKVRTYWDETDTDLLSEDSLEQHIVDYLYLAGNLDRTERDSIWPDFYKRIKEHPNKTVVDYLGEPDSPLYSPELLEEYLENFLKNTDDNTAATRSEYLLENIRKNPVGSIISDLKVSAGNRTTSLHRLIRDAGKNCLIMFYDPDCISCDAVFERLNMHGPVGLKIISISINEKSNVINDSWESALVIDEAEMDAKFYLTSLPSIYIVSENGTIIQKDIQP